MEDVRPYYRVAEDRDRRDRAERLQRDDQPRDLEAVSRDEELPFDIPRD